MCVLRNKDENYKKKKKRQNYIIYDIWYSIYNMKFGILKKTAENGTQKCLDKIK